MAGSFDYDLFVIGGGSGGVRAGRVAAGLGRRVAIAEQDRFGGTCVIRGCVPKKLFVYASQFAEHFEDARGFGWWVDGARFDWPTLIANKDREIARLEGLYRKGLEANGAEIFASRAELVGPHEVRVAGRDRTVTAERILIATGGHPNRIEGLPGHELCITSNEAFHLERLPASLIIYGAGYIAVEFAGIFAGLGVPVTLVYRGDHILRGFDHDLSAILQTAMRRKGISIVLGRHFAEITATRDGGRHVLLDDGSAIAAEMVMLATGRLPNTDRLGLEQVGVATGHKGEIRVDRYSRSSVPHILAVGDVTDRLALTPVAIHEAMCVVETEFKDNPTPVDHELVATAVFSQPEIGTVGLPEHVAALEFETVDVYKASFRPMRHTLSGRDEQMMVKIVVDAASGRVLGVHIIGPDAGELAQAVAIAVKMGATKADFDRTMAVHPTAAEELVTMYEPSYRLVRGERVG
ncbi:MAG: glutathione-disulfide reductase [Alphaproteobacteria bacterium]|nr:MAG: glutathione-disulfide reductase [Alphaproteobacteria bacterium]